MKVLRPVAERGEFVALVLIFGFLTSCASVGPDADPVLVRAQQTYDSGREAANALFVFEDQNEADLERLLPGTHARVEALRRRAKANLPRLLKAIDDYKALRDAIGTGDLVALTDAVAKLTNDLVSELAKLKAAPRPSAQRFLPLEVAA